MLYCVCEWITFPKVSPETLSGHHWLASEIFCVFFSSFIYLFISLFSEASHTPKTVCYAFLGNFTLKNQVSHAKPWHTSTKELRRKIIFWAENNSCAFFSFIFGRYSLFIYSRFYLSPFSLFLLIDEIRFLIFKRPSLWRYFDGIRLVRNASSLENFREKNICLLLNGHIKFDSID